MKKFIRVSESYWRSVVQYYVESLTEMFQLVPLTPTTKYHVEQALSGLQRQKQQVETHKAWSVPMKPVFDLETQTVGVEIDRGNLSDGDIELVFEQQS